MSSLTRGGKERFVGQCSPGKNSTESATWKCSVCWNPGIRKARTAIDDKWISNISHNVLWKERRRQQLETYSSRWFVTNIHASCLMKRKTQAATIPIISSEESARFRTERSQGQFPHGIKTVSCERHLQQHRIAKWYCSGLIILDRGFESRSKRCLDLLCRFTGTGPVFLNGRIWVIENRWVIWR